MDPDTEALAQIIERALYMHIEAVRNVIAIEYDPKTSSNGRTHLSSEAARRENQYRHLNWAAYDAFKRAGLDPGAGIVEGRWLLPYRRKCYAEISYPGLKRVGQVFSRIQDGILRARVAGLEGMFSNESAASDAGDLLMAINEFDYPLISRIARTQPAMRQALHNVLRITHAELEEMGRLNGEEEWHRLDEDDGAFNVYYVGRIA